MHEADVALLDQVGQREVAVYVLLRDRNDQAQIGFDHLLLCVAHLTLSSSHGPDSSAELTDRRARVLGKAAQISEDFRDTGG